MTRTTADAMVYSMHSIQALAKYELAQMVGHNIGQKMTDILGQVQEQPAEVQLIRRVINPSLLPFIQLPQTRFDSYLQLRSQAQATIKLLKETTPCTYKDITYLISGIYCATPRDLFALWNEGHHHSSGVYVPPHSLAVHQAHTPPQSHLESVHAHLALARQRRNNFGSPVANIAFKPDVNNYIEF